MEFEGQYLTYEDYKALGGTLDLMPFNLLELEARNQIDLKTKNRLINEKNIPQKVKICVYNLINKIDNYALSSESSNNTVASESIDGYSATYITPDKLQEIVKSKNTEIQDIILSNLYGVIINNEHIIYNG